MPGKKKKLTRKQRITLRMKQKLALLFVVIVLILLGIIVRLVYINRVSGDQYTKRVLSQQDTDSTTLPYRRGDIYDRNGTVLATSEKMYNVILDPGVLWEYYDEDADEDYVEPTLQALVDCFGLDRSELDTIMEEKKSSHYVVLAKELSKDEIQEFEDLADESGSRIAGVWMEDTYVRTYPYDSLACNVIGYTVSGDVGQYGIEQEYSDILNGENGRSYNYLNEDMEQETTVQAAVDGYSVVSTIDVTLQRIVEEAIAEFQQKYTDNYHEGEGSSTAAAIMMDPNTGEILAMASNRSYDLNNPYDLVANGVCTEEEYEALTEDERLELLNELWRNYCVSDTYEPGSVAKPLTIAAVLETGAVYDGETFLCDGYQEVGGYTIYCSHRSGHGIIDLQGALTFSCNDALMQIASKLGTDNFSIYQNLFNLGLRTGIDLPGEARTDSLIYYSESMATSDSSLIMGSTDLATNSFGQNYNVTMVQMAAAFSACINGGYYYQPHVVSKILDSDGGTVKTIEPTVLREPISSKTSEILRQYLYETIYGDDDANGNTPTGRNARIAGYSLGGKTGTAEKIPRDKTNYLVSFIGFAPADDPQVVLYVIVDEPNAEKQSSASYAIEIWKNIMEEALPYLNIPQTEEIPEDLLDEIEAEEEESTEETEETEEEEATEDGTLVDPQTGETVTMPDPETEDSDDVLGDTPVNDNLVDVEPEDALSEDEDENPTE